MWNPAKEPAETPPPLSFRIARMYDPTLVYNPEEGKEEEDVDLMAQLNSLRERKAQKTKERILQERAKAEKEKLAQAEAKIKILQEQREEKIKATGELVAPAEQAPDEPKRKRKRSFIGTKKKKISSEEKKAAKKLQHEQKKEFLIRTQSMSSIDPNKKIDFRAEAAAARSQQPWSTAPVKPPKRAQRAPAPPPAAVARESSPVVPESAPDAVPGAAAAASAAPVPDGTNSSPSANLRRAVPKRDSLGSMTATIQLKSKLEKLSGLLTEIEGQTTAGESSQWETAKSLVAEMLTDIASTNPAEAPSRRVVPQRRTLVNAPATRSPNRRSLQVPRKSSSGSQTQLPSGLFAQVETAPIPSAETAVLMRNMSPRAPDETAPVAPPGSPPTAPPRTSQRQPPPPQSNYSPRSAPPVVSPRRTQPANQRGTPPVVSPRRKPPSMVQAPDGSMLQNELPSAHRGRGVRGAVRGRGRGMPRRLSSPSNFGQKVVRQGSPLAPAEEAALPPVEKIDQEMQDLIDDLLLTR